MEGRGGNDGGYCLPRWSGDRGFGWTDIVYYATQILPRTLEGGSIDPYNPGVPTYSTLLRHLFMREPALNPHPLWNAPSLFFFLRPLLIWAIVVSTLLGLAMKRTTLERRDFAWFTVAVLLLSTSTGAYTFTLLLLPVVLSLEDARLAEHTPDRLPCPVGISASTCAIVSESLAAVSSVLYLGARVLGLASAEADRYGGSLQYADCLRGCATTLVELRERTRAAFRANRGGKGSNFFVVTRCFQVRGLLPIVWAGPLRIAQVA